MLDRLRERIRAARRRAGRIERREVNEFRRWLETTSNLTRASVLLFVPVLMGFVTLLSQLVPNISFLLFPPLASSTYTLFADPEGRYAEPRRFVGGLTLGAFCGWLALEATAFAYGVSPTTMDVHASGAALAILFTGMSTWLLDLELPTAFSTALLVLLTGNAQLAYLAGVLVSSLVVAGVFVAWRRQFYKQRARYLYQTTQGDDHVLVPMRGEHVTETAMFGARVAAAHDAAKVVLLDVMDERTLARATRARLDEDVENPDECTREEAAAEAARELERHAGHIETRVGVPVEVVVAVDRQSPAETVFDTAERTNCDLVVTPYEEEDDATSPFVRTILRGPVDAIAFRSATGSTTWKRVMVPVRTANDIAHAMIDYAGRLAGHAGIVSVCTCIDHERERRGAESMLANLVETTDCRSETRVSRSSIESFIERNDAHYDLVVLGASSNRSAASRVVSPPTFSRIDDVETDVAIAHRA
ncbi:HPP family protein [Salarchaeum japonicum]|uniref:HPP family protein n=1 Tax=Salarchaeum japonicum TaxID=555573 RepID=UPI003C777651